jgi:N-acetylmuramoyl-L-alanine amidase
MKVFEDPACAKVTIRSLFRTRPERKCDDERKASLRESARPSLRWLLAAIALAILYPANAPAAAGDRSYGQPAPSSGALPKGSDQFAALPSLAKQLALGVKCIVIDPGHGGKDTGAISCHNIAEKDITLTIARALKESLETAFGCKVILTRTRDQFIALDERTRIANAAKADLFLSIHANAHKDPTLSGVETYSLNFAKDQESARVAALENAPSKKTLSDLRPLLQQLLLTTKINESAALASQVQFNIIAKLRAKGDKVRDLGVKQAPFQVLLGAEMPSVLIETAFISNAKDECRLNDRQFQQNLVKGITAGVKSYLMEIKKVAKAGERS